MTIDDHGVPGLGNNCHFCSLHSLRNISFSLFCIFSSSIFTSWNCERHRCSDLTLNLTATLHHHDACIFARQIKSVRCHTNCLLLSSIPLRLFLSLAHSRQHALTDKQALLHTIYIAIEIFPTFSQ